MDYTIATPSQLGPILKGCRRQQGLTQRDLGEKVALLQHAVSAIEANPGKANVDRLFRLLSALDLELVLREKTESSPVPEMEW